MGRTLPKSEVKSKMKGDLLGKFKITQDALGNTYQRLPLGLTP